MIRETPWPAGIPSWADLATSDLEGASALYGEAFGWDIPEGNPEFGGYRNASLGGRKAVGMMPLMAEGQPSAWTLYIATDDVEATAAAITANGGTILAGPHPVATLGHMLVAADPQGGVFGCWQAGDHIGAEVTSEPGSIAWEHCVQPDAEAGQAFYGAVFGWVFEPIPGAEGGFTFSGKPGEPPYGSFGSMGPTFPAGWQLTLGAESADRVVGLFEAAGGKTLMPASDTPWGRMAMLEDPAGALITVMETGSTPTPERA